MSRALPVAALALTTLVSASSAHAAPFFQQVPNAFGTQPCPGQEGCWTNYLRMTDIDGDGDLDLLMPNADGYFYKGQPEPFVVYLNDGMGNFTDQSQKVVGGFTGYLRQIAVGDVDGDGYLDIYAPSAWGDADAFFINDGKGVLVDEAALRLPGVHSHAGAARFGDVDGDGDLDLLVSDGWAQSSAVPAHLYLNDGTGHFTDATDQLPTTKLGEGPIDFDLVDVDGDLDLDLVIDMHVGISSLWINDGTGHFTDASSRFPAQPGLKYGPVACDVDGDGDLDLWFDNAGPAGTEQLLINDGTGHFTDETAARVTGNPSADDNGLACIDVDGDGDFDVAIASLSDQERVLINDGTGHFTLAPGSFSAANDGTLWFDFGDVNGDGRLDCVTGQGEQSFLNALYLGTSLEAVDVVPPKFRAVGDVALPVKVGDTPIVKFAVSDNATTDEGPRLKKAYVHVTLPDGSVTDARATFMGGDLFRAVLPESEVGTVSYAACATDRQGNNACSTSKSYAVVLDASTTSSAMGGGGAAAASSGGAGSPEGGNASGAVSPSGGCSCELARADETSLGLSRRAGAILLGLALLARATPRRRRNRSRLRRNPL